MIGVEIACKIITITLTVHPAPTTMKQLLPNLLRINQIVITIKSITILSAD